MTLEVLKALVVILELHESRLLQELSNGPVMRKDAMRVVI